MRKCKTANILVKFGCIFSKMLKIGVAKANIFAIMKSTAKILAEIKTKGVNILANNITVERARYGYSQEELAKMVGVARNTVASWESNVDSCTIKNMVTLSSVFGCSVDYLIGLTDRRERNIETRNV